eukprot:SAG25_NODE_544_length_7044_cov_3.670122_3_plen_80_part_00
MCCGRRAKTLSLGPDIVAVLIMSAADFCLAAWPTFVPLGGHTIVFYTRVLNRVHVRSFDWDAASGTRSLSSSRTVISCG